MKKMLLGSCMALLFFSQAVLAQDAPNTQNAPDPQDSTNTKDSHPVHKRRSYFKMDLAFLSDNVYLGRSDSLKTPYFTPTISYHHKSGLFASVSASYLTTEQRIDMYTLSGGYAFGKGNWDGEITAEKYIFSSGSYSVKSEMKGDVSLFTEYDLGFIEPSISAGITFGDATDYSATLGLEHDFSLAGDALSITPGFFANAASQNYYNSYYQKRRYAKNRKGQTVVANVTASTADAARFRVLDYEITVPILYRLHRVTFGFTPTYAIPVNPNSVTVTVSTTTAQRTHTYNENLTNRFFWTANVAIKL